MTKAFDKIAAGLEDAIVWAAGDETHGREVKPIDVRAIRNASRMTQAEFARTYRVPLGTLRDWEQYRRLPDAGSRMYLAMIGTDPVGVQEIIAKVN